MIKILYIFGGSLSLVLGIIGIFLPGLPSTPFVLLSGFLYAKGSDRLYKKLLKNRYFGPIITNYKRKQGITTLGKLRVLFLMTAMISFSVLVLIKDPTIKIVVISAGIIGIFVIIFLVPKAKDET